MSTDPFGFSGTLVEGQFLFMNVVGQGGFSVVYRGQHVGLREPIAIKCLRIPPGGPKEGDAALTQRFHDESRIAYRLSQGNLGIVRSLASGVARAPRTGSLVPFMALEWLDGYSLAVDFRLRRDLKLKGRPIEEVLDMFAPVASALAWAHSQGIAHRDLKPANLFVTQTRGAATLKLLDFGMAKIFDPNAAGFRGVPTVGGHSVFSPQHAAPEQFEPKVGPVGAPTDVYALALVLAEALSDRPAREKDSFAELHASVLLPGPGKQPTPRQLGAQVTDPVEAVFARALSVDPANRQRDASELWNELRAAAGRSASVPPSRIAATVVDAVSPFATLGMPVASPPPPPAAQSRPPLPRTIDMPSVPPPAMMPSIPPPPRNPSGLLGVAIGASVPPPSNRPKTIRRRAAVVACLLAALAVALLVALKKPQGHRDSVFGALSPRVDDSAQLTAPTTSTDPWVAPAASHDHVVGRGTERQTSLVATGGRPAPTGDETAVCQAPAAADPMVARVNDADRALVLVDSILASCKTPNEPTGKGKVYVTFHADGSVSSVSIHKPPYANTATGECAMSRYRAARMDPYDGEAFTVEHVFVIPN